MKGDEGQPGRVPEREQFLSVQSRVAVVPAARRDLPVQKEPGAFFSPGMSAEAGKAEGDEGTGRRFHPAESPWDPGPAGQGVVLLEPRVLRDGHGPQGEEESPGARQILLEPAMVEGDGRLGRQPNALIAVSGVDADGPVRVLDFSCPGEKRLRPVRGQAGGEKGEGGQEGRLRGRGAASIIRKPAVREREGQEPFDEGRGFGRRAFHDVIIITQVEVRGHMIPLNPPLPLFPKG